MTDGRAALGLVGLLLAGLASCGDESAEVALGDLQGASLRAEVAPTGGADGASTDDAAAGEEDGAGEGAGDGSGTDGAGAKQAGAADAAETAAERGYLSEKEEARFTWIDFSLLTDFDYPLVVEMDSADGPPPIPDEVKALDGELVAVEGFMNPLVFDGEGVSEFMLVADPTFCCFGATPRLNHFVHVKMPEGERTEFYALIPLAVYGRMEVGPEFEYGVVTSLFRLDAEHVFGDY